MPKTDDLLEWTREFSRTLEDAPDTLTGAQIEEMEIAAQEKRELDWARREIEDSYLPGWKAYAIEAGADIVSPIARLAGQTEYADLLNRASTRIEQAASERDEQGLIPAIIKRGIRGAGRSLTTMAPAAAATGGYGAIAIASAQESNRAWTEGKDAGLAGKELAGFVVAQGVVEGAPAAVMQRMGLGGVEKLLSKKSVSAGVSQGLKRLGITAVQELPEELFTEISHTVVSKLAGVDPSALDKDSLKRLVADTTVQTLITVGMSNVITAGRQDPNMGVTSTIDKMIVAAAEEGAPSRSDWDAWNMPPELGKSQKQRKSFVSEVSQQIQEEGAQEPPEAAVTPEGAEGVLGPETAPEAAREPVDDPTATLGLQWEAFKVGDTTVVKNPKDSDRQAMVAEFREKYPDAPRDEPKTRSTMDAEGNKYIWLSDKTHEQIEPGINRKFNTITNQNMPEEAPDELQKAPVAAQRLLDPQEGDNEYTSLSKQGGISIRERLGIEELGEEAAQTFDVVMGEVIAKRADEGAMALAEEVLTKKRQTTAHEHVAMVLKAEKLLQERDTAKTKLAESAEQGNQVAHDQAQNQIDAVELQLDVLTAAARNARREVARALSIGRLRLSRESFDMVDMLAELQAAKGPGQTVTQAERRTISARSDKYKKAVAELEKVQELILQENEELARIKAEQVVAKAKPKKGLNKSYGAKLRERAAAEREDIKKQIRQMGLRVNDITGLAQEAVYLLGRLGITYIKSGVGTLADLVTQMQTDLPDMNLTDMDVYEAINTKDPSRKSREESETTNKVRKFKSMGRVLKEIDDMSKGIDPGVVRTKSRAAVDAEMKALQKRLTKARNAFFASEMEAAKIERAIEIVNQLQEDLANGRTRMKEAPKEIPPQLAAIRENAKQLRREIAVDEEIVKLKRQMETGEFEVRVKREKKPIDERLARKQIELNKIRKEHRQMVADAAPMTVTRGIKQAAALAKSIKATADISFTMRQNIWQVFAHPLRTSRAFIPALKTFFSENASDEIYNGLVNGENGFLYLQSGLAILDASSPDAQQRSEVFRDNVIERSKLPVLRNFGAIMKASSRHAVAIGNLVRTSAFDAFLENNPNATGVELAAFADYLNVSTGLGNLGRAGAVAETLQVVFFSPKFAVSRFQTPLALKKHWSQPRVRKEIAKDMVKFASTGGLVLTLASLAGWDVEWLDPDDPDWGKIRIGDTRIDIWGGFQQPMRLIYRSARVPFGDTDFDVMEAAGRFASYKAAPIITLPLELAARRTAVGEETTALQTLATALVPLVYEDMHEAWKHEGLGAALGTGALAFAGVGVATYPDNETAARRRIKNLRSRGEHGKANRLKGKWNRDHPNNRIVSG